MTSSDKIQEVISNFSCKKDIDIENFLKEKSIKYENLSKSRTYFIIDEEMLKLTGKFNIIAYFSISIKVLEIPNDFSRNKIRKLDGISYQIHKKRISEVPAFLIGQLAKNDLYSESITGKQIIDFAVSRIYEAYKVVGGRVILVEAVDNDKIIDFYKENGFEIIRKDEDKLIQLIRMVEQNNLEVVKEIAFTT